jgi:cell division protease FtsH
MDDKPKKQSKRAKIIRSKAGSRVLRFRINPFVIVITFFLLFFLISGISSEGSTTQAVSLDRFIRDYQDNQYSTIEIRDAGEIVAQDKYVVVTEAEEYIFPDSNSEGDLGATTGIEEVELNDIVERLQPEDAIAEIRSIISGEASNRVSELIIARDFILALGVDSTADHVIVKGVSEADLELALKNQGLNLFELGVQVTPLRTAAELVELESFNERFSNGLFEVAFSVDGLVYGRLSDQEINTYSLQWDGGFNSFVSTLQDEGISLSGDNSVIVTFPVATVPWGDIISLLTLVGFLVLGFVLFRGIQSSGSGLMRFGQSKARMFWGVKPDITFADVAGVDEAKEELSEIVQFLKHPNKFRKLGARIPKGVLMIGPPGTGKTLMARAIAGEAGVPFFHTSGSEFEEMLVGAGASRVRDLFEKAKKASPALIFIDEIDAVARKRGTTIQSGTTEQTLNQILVEMDGFEQSINVIVIAATNRPDVLDPAILRPGRFDRRVMLELPDAEGREKILGIHAENKPMADDVKLSTVAKRTIGFSGAELENTLNEAAIIAAKRNAKKIEAKDIEEAASKVTMGPAKKSRRRDEYTLKLVAYHEAGHAVVSKFMPQANPVHKVSIIARGGAGGVTEFLPLDENSITSKTKLMAHLAVALGGRAAEEIFMKDISTGASGDITQATRVAKNMVQKFGMSEKLGMIKYGDSDDLMHMGYGYGDNKDYSEDTAKMIDEEVRSLISGSYDKAVSILKENAKLVDKLTEMLLDKEVVDADDFDDLFDGVKGANPRPDSHKFDKKGVAMEKTHEDDE